MRIARSLGSRLIKILPLAVLSVAVTCAAWLSGCPPDNWDRCACKHSSYDPVIDPANFVREVTNPYFPLTRGTTRVYESETDEGTERTEVTVTGYKKKVMGVRCTVVRDTVTLNGEVVEDTYDWFAQDIEGNVWYMGEASVEMEDGAIVSAFGSWEAGVDCAKPGIIMKAQPMVGDEYRQEYYKCIAEDMGRVLALGESVEVAYGAFNDCVKTADFTPLDPSANEEKYYAPGIGHILTIEGGKRAEELVEIVME
jgi:hypothetical protein